MASEDISPEILVLLSAVTGKRARIVIDHILAHGHITSEDLATTYGYNHPPRAIRDVREQGIPIETRSVSGADGRRIAEYRFGDFTETRSQILQGRTVLSRRLKSELVEANGARCNVYLEVTPESELQIDHRVPFHVAGEHDATSIGGYQLLCRSANRDKSWSCEHCPNWETRDEQVCKTCYWAYPESYSHVATRQIRRLDILWNQDEIDDFEEARLRASEARLEMAQYVKELLRTTRDDDHGAV